MRFRAQISQVITEKNDPREAAERALAKGNEAAVRAWMRRARKLFREMPPETWLYWQESTMCLMTEGPEGERYTKGDGSDCSAVIAQVYVPKSDAGAW